MSLVDGGGQPARRARGRAGHGARGAGRGALAARAAGGRRPARGRPGRRWAGWCWSATGRRRCPGRRCRGRTGSPVRLLLAVLVLGLLVLGRSPRCRAAAGRGAARVWRWCWCPPGWCRRAGHQPVGRWSPATSGRATPSCWPPGGPGWAVLVDAGPEDGLVDACLDRLGVHGARAGRAQPPARRPRRRARRRAARPRGGGSRGRSGAASRGGRCATWPRRPRLRRRPLVQLTAGQPHAVARADHRGPRPAAPGAVARPRTTARAVNDSSLVLRAATAAGTVLLTGDVELAAQADLLAAGVDLRADVLKMPHHGSRYTSAGFLAAVAPRAVLVSVGAGQPLPASRPGPAAAGWSGPASPFAAPTRAGTSPSCGRSGGADGTPTWRAGRSGPAPRRTPNSSPGAIRCPPVAGGRPLRPRGPPAPRGRPCWWRARSPWDRSGRPRRRGS